MDTSIIGRQKEIQKLDRVLQSKKSEFLAVYGRRRVGKTFLIREYFNYTFDFQISGLGNANTQQQLFNLMMYYANNPTSFTKRLLKIGWLLSNNVAWRGKTSQKSAQIDLLIDRCNQVINLCECKFSLDSFSIDKGYAEKLRSKIATFKTATKTKKSVFLTMITTYGVEKNKYANLLVRNEVTMDDLFS
ncbi:MAG: hypothetical protein R3E32_03820 [Chitinophagales bacterium]